MTELPIEIQRDKEDIERVRFAFLSRSNPGFDLFVDRVCKYCKSTNSDYISIRQMIHSFSQTCDGFRDFNDAVESLFLAADSMRYMNGSPSMVVLMNALSRKLNDQT